MLDTIRKFRKSLLGLLIIGFVVLAMLPFGSGLSGGEKTQDDVAIRIDKTEISQYQYRKRLDQLKGLFRQQLGENFQRFAGMLNLEQQTIDDLINTALLKKLAGQLGLTASTSQIESQIASSPYFAGTVTRESYENFLRAQGLTGPQLEEETKQQIIAQQLQSLFVDLSSPSDAELKQAYIDENRKAAFKFISFSATDFEANVDMSNIEAIKAHFTDNAELYRKPRSVSFTAAAFAPDSFMDKVELSEEDLRSAYEERAHTFTVPARIKLRRIVVYKKKPATELEKMLGVDTPSAAEAPKPDAASDAERAKAKVDKALAELTGDRSFADVAASFSEEPGADKNGGDFGWKLFSDLEAKSRRAISELDKGEHSSAVETEDSFQIFFVEDRQEKHAKPFTEVREQIKHDLQRADAPEYAQAAAQEFLAAWEEKNRTESTSLQAFAASRGITVFSADKPLARGQGSGTITPALVEKVIPLAQGDRDVIQVNDVAYAVEVIQVKDSYIPELDEVREQVENSYRREQARKLAKETAEKALAELNEVKNPEAVAAKFSAKVEATEQATRTSANGAIFNAPDAKTMLFTLSELSPILQQVVDAGSTFYVAQLTSVALPDDRDFEKTKDELHRRESQKNANRILDVLLKTLRAQSDVHVNPDLLNRKGQL